MPEKCAFRTINVDNQDCRTSHYVYIFIPEEYLENQDVPRKGDQQGVSSKTHKPKGRFPLI